MTRRKFTVYSGEKPIVIDAATAGAIPYAMCAILDDAASGRITLTEACDLLSELLGGKP